VITAQFRRIGRCSHRGGIRVFFDLAVTCHGETEKFLVAASELMHLRDPSTGREVLSPLYVVAFEGAQASKRVRVIQTSPNLFIRLMNATNRLRGD
jgi:hypothetical protein